MKQPVRFAVAALFLLTGIVAPLSRLPARAGSQAQEADQKNSESQRAPRSNLEIGAITVSLGMNQDKALHQFSEAGYKLKQPNPDTWLISTSSTSAQVSFREGQLIYASREWLTGHTGELEAVAAALGSLSGDGPANCKLSHHPFSAPSANVQWVSLSCGHSMLRIGVGSADGDHVRAVTESIGAL